MKLILLCCAALVTAAVAAVPASASTVAVDQGVVRYTGTAQRDSVMFTYDEGRATIIERSGPVTAGAGCVKGDSAGVAYCPVPAGTRLVADMGDGNDWVEGSIRKVDQLRIEANGGPGSDELAGNAGPDVLVGGPGSDELRGHEGDDVLDLRDGSPDSLSGSDCDEGDDVLEVDPKGVDGERYSDGCERIEVARALGGTAVGGFDDARVLFTANPGVKNDLTITQEGKGLRMTDPAGIDAGTGCVRDRPADATTVYCANTDDAYKTDINLGDGDDRLRVVGELPDAESTIRGEAGDDAISDGADGSVIDGGPGDDTIAGGAGFDTVNGGDGNDVLSGGPDLDRFDGGAGSDRIDARDGSFQLDSVIGESPECGRGADVLTADVSDFPKQSCEKSPKSETSPAAKPALRLTGSSTLRMTTSGTPSLRVTAKCVNGPCAGRAYLFGSSSYAVPFNATGQAYRLASGKTATLTIRFGSGYGDFRRSIAGKRVRMYLATLVGDASGRTRTVRRAVTVSAPKNLR
jgi:Ca2+-binding RTX toxin-like protein